MEISYKKIVDDYVKWVEKHQKPKFTNFFEPTYLELIEDELKKYDTVTYKENGGYEKAERKIIGIFPTDLDYNLNFPISAISVTPPGDQNLTHRDYLGAILGLGLARNKIGDILIVDSKAQIIVMDDIKDYIINNLARVGNISVIVNQLDINEIILPEEKCKEIFTTVSSLRLDSVASSAFNISRSKIAEIIKIGRVEVNWKTVDNVSYNLKEGDIISVRGRGRAKLYSIEGKTAKNRVKIHIKRFL
ncbi:MAG: YlmH/Sll1252 family protein [Thermoanaerobacteraceae bacterium]|nr:YlmH/Sll1252 family protein [Thermoanaerobacteraceae bacterium]